MVSKIQPSTNTAAATTNAASWVSKNLRAAGSTLVNGASKVANFAVSIFQAASQYLARGYGFVKNAAVAAFAAVKANPNTPYALGALALAAVVFAVYSKEKKGAAV